MASGPPANPNNNAPSPEQVQFMAAELARLQEVEARGNRDLGHLQQQLAAARAQALDAQRAAAAAQAAAAEPRASIKLPPVEKFKGSATDRFGCTRWLRQLNHQFGILIAGYPVEPPTRRINLATAYFEGAADLWWRTMSEEDRARHSASWSAFEDALHERFSPVQAAELARSRLLSLRQTHSLDAFVNRFLEELSPIQEEMHPHDQVHHFRNGLKDTRVVQKLVETKPATLIEAINLATHWDAFFTTMPRAPGNHFNNYRNGSQPAFVNRGASHSSGSVPMEVSAVESGFDDSIDDRDDAQQSASSAASSEPSASEVMKRLAALEKSHLAAVGHNSGGNRSNKFGHRRDNNSRVPGLTAAEVADRRRANACLRCGKAGHWKNECPNKSLNL